MIVTAFIATVNYAPYSCKPKKLSTAAKAIIILTAIITLTISIYLEVTNQVIIPHSYPM